MQINVSIYNLPLESYVKTINNLWFHDRVESIVYKTNIPGERAAEEAYHLANAELDYLTDYHREIIRNNENKRPILQIGDIVRVEDVYKPKGIPAEYYLCVNTGWEKFDGDVIQLLKHLN